MRILKNKNYKKLGKVNRGTKNAKRSYKKDS